MAEDTLTITDNRTGCEYTPPITDGPVRATDLHQIRPEEDDAYVLLARTDLPAGPPVR